MTLAAPPIRLKSFLPYLIFLLAFALRAWQLAAIPPGLTHDEAAHGHDAAHILQGVIPIYFPIGYGREPLFDYFNAVLLATMGVSPLALRFSAAIWGMLALAATYRTARLCFDRTTALLALALMAVSFWPLATSRQILRSSMLPGEMGIAVILFLQMLRKKSRDWRVEIGLGLAITASLYTYIPARVLWLMFPLALITPQMLRFIITRLGTRQPNKFKIRDTGYVLSISHYKSLALSLLIAFCLAASLFLYLYQHPGTEQRIDTLSGPLTALLAGNPAPLLENARAFALALFLPGQGDRFLAYNLPGQPVFDLLTALLAAIGLGYLIKTVTSLPRRVGQGEQLSVSNHRQLLMTNYWLLLYWLVIGLAPSFITGPEALTTRIIGAQPVLYILPAVGIMAIGGWLLGISRWRLAVDRWPVIRHLPSVGISLFIGTLFIITAHDYFFTWGQSPDVRAAYQSTTMAMLKMVAQPSVISTVYPAAPHDPYIGELLTTQATRWVDGRLAMIYPAETGWQLLVPASTPLHPLFIRQQSEATPVYLRPDDLDPYFTLTRISLPPLAMNVPTGQNFNNAVTLLHCQWLGGPYHPGETAELVIELLVTHATQLGPRHPPTFTTDLNLFTHILQPDSTIFLQQDRLDAPTWDWQTDDTIIQIHPFAIPAEAAPGDYTVEVGLYDRASGERLPVIDSGATSAIVAPLIIRK